MSLAVIKVSPEAAGGLPESSPEKKKKKKQLQEMKRSGIFLLNSRLLFKTVFKKIKTSIWLVDDIYVNRAEPRLEFWARVCLLSVTFLIVISRHAHTGSRYQNTRRLKGSCWDLRYQLALVPNNSNPGLSGEQKRLQIFFSFCRDSVTTLNVVCSCEAVIIY